MVRTLVTGVVVIRVVAGRSPLFMRKQHHSIITGFVLLCVSLGGSSCGAPPDAAGRMKPVVVGVLYTRSRARALPGKDRLENYTSAIKDNGGSVVPLAQTLDDKATAARLASIAVLS